MNYIVICDDNSFINKTFETLQEAYNYSSEYSYIFDGVKIYELKLYLEV